jgi:methylase of polypeptide subunit release factors
MENVTGFFDVVFMNPPYVTLVDLLKIGARENSTEFSSGYGGITGGEITKMFVNSLNLVLQRNGIAILGINTKYLPDKAITDIILNSSDVKIKSRHYSDWQVPPFSQVYLLNRL